MLTSRFTNNPANIIFIVSIVSFFPMLFYLGDLWDGLIIRYAFESKNPEILTAWFNESGSPLGAFVTSSLYWISSYLPLHHKLFLNLFIYGMTLAAAWQIFYLCKEKFAFSQLASTVAAMLYIVNPSWHILTSSIFVFIPLWNFFGLIGIRLLLSDKAVLHHVVGALLLCFSMHYAANPMLFLPLLAYFFIGLGPERAQLKGMFWILFAVAYFVTFRQLFPASNLYATYNKITSQHLLDIELYLAFGRFIAEHYLYLPILVLLTLPKLKSTTQIIRLLFFVCLLVSSIIPFVVVNKVVSGDIDWTSRVTVNLTIAIAFFSAFLINEYSSKPSKIMISIGMTVVLLSLYVNLINGYSEKIKALMYQETYVNALKDGYPSLEPGLIYTKNTSYYAPDLYELNYYFYSAYGDAHWFITMDKDPQFAHQLTANQGYRDKYVASDFTHKCTFTLENKIFQNDISKAQLWLDFMNLFASERWIDVNHDIDLKIKGCTHATAQKRVELDNPDLSFSILKQTDIENCTSFDFSPGEWHIHETLNFDKSCSVSFHNDSILYFNSNTFMVINGSTKFPEISNAKFSGKKNAKGLNNNWGGILLTSEVAHVQNITVEHTVGFTYKDNHFPAGLNLVENSTSSVHRSNFMNNQQALFTDVESTRITDNNFISNEISINVEGGSVTFINNVVQQSGGAGVLLNASAQARMIRNVLLNNDADAIKLNHASVLFTHFNLIERNRRGISLDKSSSVVMEADLFDSNGMMLHQSSTDSHQVQGGGMKFGNENLSNAPNAELMLELEKIFQTSSPAAVSQWKRNNFKDCKICSIALEK